MAAGETHRRLEARQAYQQPELAPEHPYLQMGVRSVRIVDPASRTGRERIGDAWIAAETLEVPARPSG